ncbi:hypothetical protein [Hippea sp. KM1]|uniref:hypothetical protein n=1 Tax=Hippea sp. KM1 TaxID=944481 RepID=UPI0004B00505|nr:hypothetical protein [Hippea sp. KM1]
MATYTAQILIGRSHIYQGGITPNHVLFLSENSRSAWILRSLSRPDFQKVFVCDPNTLIKDAVLITAIFILKSEKLLERLPDTIKKTLKSNYLELYRVIHPKILDDLYGILKDISFNHIKLSISIFDESSIKGVGILEKYKDLEFEVCTTFYSRTYNPFNDFFLTDDKISNETSIKQHINYLRYIKDDMY